MPQLLGLLSSSSLELAGAAAAALMMLTLAKEGKVAVHQVCKQQCCRCTEQHAMLPCVHQSLLSTAVSKTALRLSEVCFITCRACGDLGMHGTRHSPA